MKLSLVVVLAGLCVLAAASPVDQHGHKFKVADKAFLEKQKKIMPLFQFINQKSFHKDHIDLNWDLHEHKDAFTHPEVVEEFLHLWKHHEILPKHRIFSVFYDHHLEQAKLVFKIMHYAKDFDTFHKTAIWMRNHINEGMFLYTFSVAIAHRPDCYGLILPPIYEIYPHYFFGSEVIEQAHYYKQIYHGDTKQGDKPYIIHSNYSGHYLNLHPEQSMSYYLEDVGINAFYYYYNLYYPFWMDGEEFHLKNDKRGELYYYVYQQLLARFYLERLSNDFGEIEYFNWDLPIETPYYPSLRYPNGLEFPERPNFVKLHEYFYNYGQKWSWKSKFAYSFTKVQDFERRVRDAIDKGYCFTHEGKKIDLHGDDGFNVLGNLIQSNPDSPDHIYYGSVEKYARHLLGYSYTPLDHFKVAPSALEHFETSMRDPIFYQIYKRIILNFQKYKSHLSSYSEEELTFHGVEVKDMEVDRLITYFDFFDSVITHSVAITPKEYEEDKFQVRVRQPRLNHKSFTYKVHVHSDKEVKAVVKIFLGPKYDEYGRFINISENRLNFVEIDHFVHDLKVGTNTIERNSLKSQMFGPDRTSFNNLHKQVMRAYEGQDEFHIDGYQSYFHFPQRYMIPKGTENGMSYQFFVFVHPYVPNKDKKQEEFEFFYPKLGTAGLYVDGYPLGYPLDRFIEHEKFWEVLPNAHFHEVKIYHKHVNDIMSVSMQHLV